ncbi:MAG: tRNA (adenosine(37)-N6)-threonylcarbamoyltransferase complex ATPase subunit type 1 TsaE [Flavobacteriales bacterium]|nr:tRNA (adenosine(37)-N6)-threonylcarbamoyltransferase complex ATPase subunit type 1 TsaE [Flavobacteriales bacterium]
MSKTFYASKVEELDEIAKSLIKVFKNKKKIVFFGEMGVGKTTLIKSICKVLNVQDIVTSPTFSVVNEYQTINGEVVYHFDFYRIKNQEELFDLGLEEYIYSDNYCFVEWPEKAEELLGNDFVQISITKNKDYRIIKTHL